MNPQIEIAVPELGELGAVHIYRHAGEGLRPFVLGIHGGGWVTGDQSAVAFLWPRLRALNVALVLPSYRKAPANPFPAAYDDLVRVCEWIKRSGAEHGLDPERGMLWGSSAGSHLAMLLATRGIAENAGFPKFHGVATYCGIMNLLTQYEFESANGRKMAADFLGTTPGEDPELYRLASPELHIHERMPAVWMSHGSGDVIVPVSQSRQMVSALCRAGYDPIYLEARNLGHTQTEVDEEWNYSDECLFQHDLLRFIKRSLQAERFTGGEPGTQPG